MPRIGFSSHVPDFSIISYISEHGDSPLHRSNSYLKLVFLFLIVIAATSLQRTEYLVILFFLTLLVYRACNLPMGLLWRWYFVPVSFVLTIALLFIFNEPGILIFSINTPIKIQLTSGGLILLIRLMLRTLSVVTYSFIFVMTTKYSHLCTIANTILPTPINTIFLLAYRFSFVVLEEVSSLLKALSSRGGDLVKGLLTQTRVFGGIFAVSFVYSFDRAERIAKAMEARGFEGKIATYSVIEKPSTLGILFLLLSIVVILFALFSG